MGVSNGDSRVQNVNLICDALHRLFTGLYRHRFPFEEENIPRNGIYILYEKGERAHGTDRIVRVTRYMLKLKGCLFLIVTNYQTTTV